MLTLTSTLTAAQKAGGMVLYRVTFSKTGQTTRIYGHDTTNPIIRPIIHTQEDLLQNAEIAVANWNGELTSLNLIGYTAVIEYGYNTSAGDEYQATDTMKVINQRFESTPKTLVCIFSLAGKGNQMAEDLSSGVLKQGTATSTSAGKLVDTATTFASSDVGRVVHNTTDNTWATIVEFISATQLALSADIMVNTEGYDIYGEYEAASTDTVETLMTAISQATMVCFKHCEVVTISWDLTAYQDQDLSVAFAPAGSFRVSKGQTRLEKIKWLLDKAGLDGRFEGDGKLHIFMTFARTWVSLSGTDLNEIIKPTTPSDWAATTAYSLNNRVKPTSQNGYYYVCSTAGTTGGTQPAWPTQDGLTVTDGTVVWTCRDSNYMYTCTTAGTTGNTEPVWPYTKNGTVTDGDIVWTLQYDYDYDDASDAHNFWSKGIRQRLVIPNKVTVHSPLDALTKYFGTATEAASYALLPKEDFVQVVLASNNEATDIAKAIIDRAARDAETGSGLVMMNVGQEIQDYIQFTDSRQGDTVRGRIRSITRYAGPKVFRMAISFGSRLVRSPAGILSSSVGEDEPLPNWAYTLLRGVESIVDELWAQFRTLQDTVNKLDTDAYYQTYTLEVICLNSNQDLVTGDGVFTFPLPREVDGMNLVEVYAVVRQSSAGVVATIQIYNVTQAADMLTTKVTIDVDEKNSYTAATKPVIDTANDDVAMFDQLRVDCDVGETTAVWAASTAYVLNDKLRPTVNNQNGHKYNCTTGGTTAATEPTWPTGTGATVSDGTVVWTENGATLQSLTVIGKFRKS